MILHQGKMSFYLWVGKSIPVQRTHDIIDFYFSHTILSTLISYSLGLERTSALSSCHVNLRQSSWRTSELRNPMTSIHIHVAKISGVLSLMWSFDKEPRSVLPHIQLRFVLHNQELSLALVHECLPLCHHHTSHVRSIPKRSNSHLEKRIQNTE